MITAYIVANVVRPFEDMQASRRIALRYLKKDAQNSSFSWSREILNIILFA